MFSVGVFASAAEETDYEYAFAFTGVENLTAQSISMPIGRHMKNNSWASYSLGKLLVAAEFAEKESGPQGTM